MNLYQLIIKYVNDNNSNGLVNLLDNIDNDIFYVYKYVLGYICKADNVDMIKILHEYKDINFHVEELFLIACGCGSLKVVDYLANNFDIDYANNNYYFRNACKNGYLELVELLLEKYPNINIRINNDKAFRFACHNGHLAIVKLLLERCPNIFVNTNDCEAFRYACRNGHFEIVKFLSENYEIDINSENGEALVYACKNDNYDIITYLLDNYTIDISILNRSFINVFENNNLKMCKYLIEHYNIDLNMDYEYLIRSLCTDGDLDFIKYLFNYGYTVKEIDHIQEAFCFACANGHLEVVEFLFMNVKNMDYHYDNEKAFRWACKYGNHDVLNFLLMNISDIDIQVNENEVLQNACKKGHYEIVEILLIELINKYGYEEFLDKSFDKEFKLAYTKSNNFGIVFLLKRTFPHIDHKKVLKYYIKNDEIKQWIINDCPIANIKSARN